MTEDELAEIEARLAALEALRDYLKGSVEPWDDCEACASVETRLCDGHMALAFLNILAGEPAGMVEWMPARLLQALARAAPEVVESECYDAATGKPLAHATPGT